MTDRVSSDAVGTGAELAAVDEHELHLVDVRLIRLVRSMELMFWGGLGLVALITGSIGLAFLPSPYPFVVVVAWILLAGLALFRILWWPHWVHHQWAYRVGVKVFELRRGIFWRVTVSIPLSRLQHVDLHRGPLERHWGLASLQLHTAGTKDASQLIPGLDLQVAESLRDRLIDAANRGGHERNDG